MEVRASKAFSSHMVMLIKALLASQGDVIECGGGVFSTPFLHWMCKYQGRKLITYENDRKYFDFEKKFQSSTHRIRFVENWDDIDTTSHVGVVFIDHHPSARRSVEAIRFANSADFIVIHDTEREDENYDNARIWPHFKYVYHYKDARPWTSVVSNFKDVTQV